MKNKQTIFSDFFDQVKFGTYFLIPALENCCSQYKPVTILETVMLWAFGLSWLTKSEAILSDQESQYL